MGKSKISIFSKRAPAAEKEQKKKSEQWPRSFVAETIVIEVGSGEIWYSLSIPQYKEWFSFSYLMRLYV